MGKMNLFVDDLRACPKGWQLARTVDKAIRILDTQAVEEVSLDYDIKCSCLHCKTCNNIHHTSNETFEPVARFISAENERRSLVRSYYPDSRYANSLQNIEIRVRIHTSNFDGGQRMAKIVGIEYQNYIYNQDDYEKDS